MTIINAKPNGLFLASDTRLEGGNSQIRLSGGSHFFAFFKMRKENMFTEAPRKRQTQGNLYFAGPTKFSVLKVFFTKEFCDKYNFSFLLVTNWPIVGHDRVGHN